MKISPKLILTLLALGLVAAAPVARAAEPSKVEVAPQTDQPKEPRGKAGKRVKKAADARDKQLTEKLKLTAEQQEKLAAIRKEQAEQLKSGTKAGEVLKTGRDQVRALLTPEQQKEFDAMPAEGRAGKKGKKGEQN